MTIFLQLVPISKLYQTTEELVGNAQLSPSHRTKTVTVHLTVANWTRSLTQVDLVKLVHKELNQTADRENV